MAFLISPCKKIVYCPIFKTLSTSISTYFKQHGWSEINNRSITNDHIKLIFMRHPIDRLVSALNYIRHRSNLSNDIITQILNDNHIIMDHHTQSFFTSLRKIPFQSLLNNTYIIPTNEHLEKMFNLFFKKYNYEYNFSDVPKQNITPNDQKIFNKDNIPSEGCDLDIDLILWESMCTSYNWWKLDPDYKKEIIDIQPSWRKHHFFVSFDDVIKDTANQKIIKLLAILED